MDCPLINSQPPPIEKSGHAVNAGRNDMGRIAAGGNVLRQVFEADVREGVVGLPAVGSDCRSRAYRRLDERNEAFGRYVSDTGHADAAGAPPPDFSSKSDNRFLVYFPTCRAYLTAADVCFINLDITLQKISDRLNHGAAKLMELRPGRLAAAKAKYPLYPQGIDPMLLVRHVPHRLKPELQRLPRSLDNRPRSRRCLAIASTASKLTPGRRPGLRRPAGRISETIWPTNSRKIVRTGRLGRQPLIEFPERTWVVGPADGMGYYLGHANILAQRERSEHSVSKKEYDRTWLLCPKL